jgi:hypothetical protein
MTPKWEPRTGDRVELRVQHPDKRLDYGEELGPEAEHGHVRIYNGARGVLAILLGDGALVTFDAIGPGTLLPVPLVWLVKA